MNEIDRVKLEWGLSKGNLIMNELPESMAQL